MTRHWFSLLILFVPGLPLSADEAGKSDLLVRAGMIGLDTSHATAFTRLLNDPAATGALERVEVVVALPQGSPDLAGNAERIATYTKELQASGVRLVRSMDELLAASDVILVESVDGRPHLRQAAPALLAGKRVFVDKPLAGDLADAVALVELSKRTGTPMFSGSSLRFSPEILAFRLEHPKAGKIIGCEAFSPCPTEPHHPDLFWYGIHGVEILFTIMGPGIQSVQRTRTDSTDLVVGLWEDGRIGTFRGIRDPGRRGYGATVFGTRANMRAGSFDGYGHLVKRMAEFFVSGDVPVSLEETLEIHAFMQAASESTAQDGARIKIESVMAKARKEAKKRLDPWISNKEVP